MRFKSAARINLVKTPRDLVARDTVHLSQMLLNLKYGITNGLPSELFFESASFLYNSAKLLNPERIKVISIMHDIAFDSPISDPVVDLCIEVVRACQEISATTSLVAGCGSSTRRGRHPASG